MLSLLTRKKAHSFDEAIAKLFSEGKLGTCSGAEIFAGGKQKDTDYTDKDLDDIVRNFNQFSAGSRPLHKVPAVLGHEEDQDLLNRTDIPAIGWGQTLKREKQPCQTCGTKGRVFNDKGQVTACDQCYGTGKQSVLVQDFGGVPQKIGDLINGRAYRTVSAEIYDESQARNAGIPANGMVLRRVGFLGGEVPHIKTLKDLPMVNYSEGLPAKPRSVALSVRAAHRTATATTCFCEVHKFFGPVGSSDLGMGTLLGGSESKNNSDKGTTMDRASMLQKLQECGFDTSAIDDTVSDSVLASILAFASGTQAAQNAEHNKNVPGNQPVMNNNPPTDPNAPNKLSAAPIPAVVPGSAVPAAVTPKQTTIKHQYTEEEMATFTAHFSPLVDAALSKVETRINEKLAAAGAQAAQIEGNNKLANVKSFVEAQKAAKRIAPWELDETAGQTIVDRLMRADCQRVVKKFSEGGKEVTKTELDLQMDEIRIRPAVWKHAETVKSGDTKTNQPASALTADQEETTVKTFAEENAEQLAKIGTSVHAFCETFTKVRKSNPKYTAKEYLGA